MATATATASATEYMGLAESPGRDPAAGLVRRFGRYAGPAGLPVSFLRYAAVRARLLKFGFDGLDGGVKRRQLPSAVVGRNLRLSRTQLLQQHLPRAPVDFATPARVCGIASSQGSRQDFVVVRHRALYAPRHIQMKLRALSRPDCRAMRNSPARSRRQGAVRTERAATRLNDGEIPGRAARMRRHSGAFPRNGNDPVKLFQLGANERSLA